MTLLDTEVLEGGDQALLPTFREGVREIRRSFKSGQRVWERSFGGLKLLRLTEYGREPINACHHHRH
jgi:hypothetical protein